MRREKNSGRLTREKGLRPKKATGPLTTPRKGTWGKETRDGIRLPDTRVDCINFPEQVSTERKGCSQMIN